MQRLVSVLTSVVIAIAPLGAYAQAPRSEIETLREELRRLQERLERLERGAQLAPPAPAREPARPPTAAVPVAPAPAGEREISLEKEHPFETLGLPKPEIGGARISGFFIGSFDYQSGIQIVPEAFGGAPAPTDAGRTGFRFDKFGLGVAKSFVPWLSASAAVEIEAHRDRHSHVITNGQFGCPRGLVCERFGAEAPEIEVNLDKFDVTGVVPLGSGLRVSLGRFDVPFGIERHDENLLLTATTSEIFRYGRPQKMTGLQTSYAFTPWLDATAWVVNRWESETSGEGSFEDNNAGKSFGGRIGVTPFPTERLLSLGLGGWYGSERTASDERHQTRWVVDGDVTWSPTTRLLLAAEALYGGEASATLRAVGSPVLEEQARDDVRWWGFYLLSHYDVAPWAGMTVRYGLLNDQDRGRTGVSQTLQSITITPVVHLSALIPDLKPTGASVSRSRHPYHWVDLKFEYRFNWSDRPIFGEAAANHSLHNRSSDTSQEIHVQAVVNF